MLPGETGVISYAGLSPNALAQAYANALCGEAALTRYEGFCGLFPQELIVNLPFIGKGKPETTRLGFWLSPTPYHRVLCRERPELYAGVNRRCLSSDGSYRGGVVVIDKAWSNAFEQYAPFEGEGLLIHLIGGGHQAVAVPQSFFPQMEALLRKWEAEAGITENASTYAEWLSDILRPNAEYDPAETEGLYLTQTGERAFSITQKALREQFSESLVLRELHRHAQDDSLLSLPTDASTLVPQYVPYRHACDLFEEHTVSASTARLAQLYYDGDDVISDFWLPWAQVKLYLDKRRDTLDTLGVCDGFQLAPTPDAATRGGVYPTCVRVVTVADRSLKLFTAKTINGVAYGSGMDPQGLWGEMVYLPQSADLLSAGKLTEDTRIIRCTPAVIGEEKFLAMRLAAEKQEEAGQLIDALYRREKLLSRLREGSAAYEEAYELLSRGLPDTSSVTALGGYDADLSYLSRLIAAREMGSDASALIDPVRERAISVGYVMRRRMQRIAQAPKAPKQEQPLLITSSDGTVYEQMKL